MKTRGELESEIKVCLGGTLAEEMIYGEIADGASSDLRRANHITRVMVKMLGMSRLGRVFYQQDTGNPFLGGINPFEGQREYSEETAREIDMEVRKIVEDAMIDVRRILVDRRAALEALAQRLMEKEVVEAKELQELLAAHYPGPKLVPASDAIAAVERVTESDGKEVREAKGT
jgi:cell division protease FtsH